MKHKILLLLAGLIIPFLGMAQEVEAEPQMADTFRSEGKIYVVIAVISIIFMCLISYLVYIDIKLRKLENKN
ncbi:MAG: CcmD family protein [Burkholderiales bacterium]|nr:CcmD family protein [Bacteroidia bacterium]